jgi:hypothetical protein
MATFTSYNIKSSEAVFYTATKNPTEGYEKNTYTDKVTKELKTTYHKKVESVSGVLQKMSLMESPYGERFKIFLKHDTNTDDFIVLEIPVFMSNSINPYIKSLCQYLDSITRGSQLTFTLNKVKDKNGYFYKNFYIEMDGQKLQWDFKIFGEDSPVPKPSKVVDKVTKKEKMDYTDVDAFFYEKLMPFRPETSVQNAQVQEAITPRATTATPVHTTEIPVKNPFTDSSSEVEDEDEDDLPF